MALTNIQLQQAGRYTVKYIDKDTRAEGTYTFTINVTNPNPASPITPNLKINNENWTTSSIAAVKTGDNVVLEPQPNVTAGWSWTGPNGFVSTNRRVDLNNIQPASAGFYTATYRNAAGTESKMKFLINIKGN